MSPRDHASRTGWVAALAGFVAGVTGGLFGVGGGIILVPVLTQFFGLTQHQAHGTSLAVIGATAIAGLVVYGLAGNVAWWPAVLMSISSVFAAQLGARLAAKVSTRGLTLAFAAMLVIIAMRILLAPPVGSSQHALTGGLGLVAALGTGAATGLLAGFMGVGGGAVAVPALTIVFGMSQQLAQGTSLALILVTAPFGALEHHRLGNVVTRLMPGLAIGALLGAPLASVVAQRLPQVPLARGFAVFLIANAARMAWGAWRKPRSR